MWLILGLILGWLLTGPAAREFVALHFRVAIGIVLIIVIFLIIHTLGFSRQSFAYVGAVIILGAVVLIASAMLAKKT